jgi:hypothetical protein
MKRILLTVLSFLTLAGFAFAGAPVVSAESVFEEACKQTPDSAVCQGTTDGETATNDFIQNLISLLLFAIGIISVIVIIVGGIRYTTSNGDSNKVTQAKNTILYAVIGLVVALLSYAIVTFVVNQF